MSTETARGSLEAALALAEKAHAGQRDKAKAPYIEHPKRVSNRTDDETAKIVALLHDVIEDTRFKAIPVTEADVRSEFGDQIADAVVALTRLPGEPPDDYYARIRANPLALRVKHADLSDNSDPSRLACLDHETRERLIKKYDHARVALSE